MHYTTNVTFYRVLSGSYDSQSGAYTIGASNYELQGWDGTVHQLQDVSGGQGTLFESSDLSGFQIVPSDIDPTYHVPDQYTITDRKGTVYQLNPIGFVYCTPPKDNGTIYSCYASQPMRV